MSDEPLLVIDGSLDLPTRRAAAERLVDLAAAPQGVRTSRTIIGGVGGLVCTPAHGSRGTIVHAHGGHSMCSVDSHHRLAGHLALRSSRTVVLVGYRRAPEHPWDAALDDVLAVLATLIEEDTAPVYLSGDSAGGGIALGAAVRLRDRGDQQPRAVVLVSPWLDRSISGTSMRTNATTDLFVTAAGLRALAAEIFPAVLDLADPSVSPLFAALGDLPPMLVQAASDEVLLDDARRLAERAEKAGVHVELDVGLRMQHAWHLAAGNLPDADLALDRIGTFLDHVDARRYSAATDRGIVSRERPMTLRSWLAELTAEWQLAQPHATP